MRIPLLLALFITTLSIVIVAGVWQRQSQSISLLTEPRKVLSFPTPDPAAIMLDDLAEPFYSEPCFVRLHNSCQLVMMREGESLRLVQRIVGGLEGSIRMEWFWGRELALWSGLKQYTLVMSPEDPGGFFLDRMEEITTAAVRHNLNQGFLFAVLDLLYAAAVEETPPEVLRESPQFSVEDFASSIDTALLAEKTSSSRTNAGQAIITAAALHFSPQVVTTVFAKPLSIERRYGELFSPRWPDELINLFFINTSIDESELFRESEEVDTTDFLLAVCRQGSAFLCSLESAGKMSCVSASYFSRACAHRLYQP